jgi:hypothetical protein
MFGGGDLDNTGENQALTFSLESLDNGGGGGAASGSSMGGGAT